MADEEQGEPWPWQNKAGRSDYYPPPFYYWDDEISDCPRLVGWSLDCRQMRAAMLALLDTFPPRVDILLKSREVDPEADNYKRWHGEQSREAVKQALDDFSYYVFKCGYDVLCLMNLETREYIALDEYGILWFYTSSQSHGQILEDTGFTHHKSPLVTEGGCYVSTWPDQDEWQTAFIERLGLECVSN